MTFIESKNIKVYPSAYRDKSGNKVYDPESRLPSEHQITNQIRNMTSKKGFIVSPTYSSTTSIAEGQVFEIFLGGYYFNFKLPPLSSNTKVWACIKLKDMGNSANSALGTNTDYACETLVRTDDKSTPLDVSDDFKGLAIIENNTTPPGYDYTLQLLDSSYKLVRESYIKYEGKDIICGSSSGKGIDEEIVVGNRLIVKDDALKLEWQYNQDSYSTIDFSTNDSDSLILKWKGEQNEISQIELGSDIINISVTDEITPSSSKINIESDNEISIKSNDLIKIHSKSVEIKGDVEGINVLGNLSTTGNINIKPNYSLKFNDDASIQYNLPNIEFNRNIKLNNGGIIKDTTNYIEFNKDIKLTNGYPVLSSTNNITDVNRKYLHELFVKGKVTYISGTSTATADVWFTCNVINYSNSELSNITLPNFIASRVFGFKGFINHSTNIIGYIYDWGRHDTTSYSELWFKAYSISIITSSITIDANTFLTGADISQLANTIQYTLSSIDSIDDKTIIPLI